MSNSELQNEEREVLLSIYDGDEAFKQLSPTVFQYKYGEHDNPKSFLLELRWTDNYPLEKPEVNMDTFYNKHIMQSIKNNIADAVAKESEQYLGEAMTYSLFEGLKERYEDLVKEQPEVEDISDAIDKVIVSEKPDDQPKKAPKKEQLTKAQKRRQWDRVEARGEKPRGWDWVDIVKHLSQTGSKDSEPITST